MSYAVSSSGTTGREGGFMSFKRLIKWVFIIGAGLFVLVVMLAGTGLYYISTQVVPDVEVGQVLPSISLASFGGDTIDLESYRGQVVVLDFWSSY
jgi:hypothetical protein